MKNPPAAQMSCQGIRFSPETIPPYSATQYRSPHQKEWSAGAFLHDRLNTFDTRHHFFLAYIVVFPDVQAIPAGVTGFLCTHSLCTFFLRRLWHENGK